MFSEYLDGLRAYLDLNDIFTAYSPTAASTNDDEQEVAGFTPQGEALGKVSGRSREGDTNTRYESVGGIERPVIEGGLHIALEADIPSIGWEYACTAVGPDSDPQLVGRRYRVVDVPAKSYATARRLDVVDVTD
jgi:hypothetical protein